MSEVVQGALIGGGIGLVSLLISLWFNAQTRKDDLRQRATERREDYTEWYRRTLFERRLVAVQEANLWLQKLKEAMGDIDPSAGRKATGRLLVVVEQADQWLGKNAVYLYGGRRESSALASVLFAARGVARGDSIDFWDAQQKASSELASVEDELLAVLGRPLA
jgi:hypothetical protein